MPLCCSTTGPSTMNTNSYGCGSNGSDAYTQGCYPHDLSTYYSPVDGTTFQTPTQSNHHHLHTGSTSSAYAPSALHMSHSTGHQFLDHHSSLTTGVISDSNGLSYTNLDTSGTNGVYGSSNNSSNNITAANKLGQYSPDHTRSQSTAVSTPGQLTASAISGAISGSHQASVATHYTQYRDFSSSTDSVPSSHPEMALSDCSIMRSGSVQTSSQYPYLEPTLLSRRNGYSDTSPFDISCSQLNSTPYHHLNHHTLTLHSHPQSHHANHHSRSVLPGSNGGSVSTPVTYKWMQVKRNVPKPGTSLFTSFL